jgi:hypothetical protein
MRFTERAEPSCTESIAVIASAHGGTAWHRFVARAGATAGRSAAGVSVTITSACSIFTGLDQRERISCQRTRSDHRMSGWVLT